MLPLCLRGEPRVSLGQPPTRPSAASSPGSRPVRGSLVSVVRGACISLACTVYTASLSCHGLPAAPWAPLTGGRPGSPAGALGVTSASYLGPSSSLA